MFAARMKASSLCIAGCVAGAPFVSAPALAQQVGGPPLAQEGAIPVPAQEGGTIVIEGKRDKNDRKICKSTAPPTGTRMGARRICRTAAEWQMAEERSQRLIEVHQQRQSAIDAYNQNAKNGLAPEGPP